MLRLIWPLDFEWKLDEKWMFAKAIRIADGRNHWPWVGMPSGAGAQNPGASVWPFAALAHVTNDPAVMTFCIMVLNVIALWAMALWVQKTWREGDQPLGLWGVGLFAVSPLPVLFSRKIWAQDMLPILLVPLLWGHTRRKQFMGAFAWGAVGAVLGQVHMSGFFAAAALLLATLILDRKSAHWIGWFVGSCLASLPLIPWLMFLMSPAGNHVVSKHTLSLRFFGDAFLNASGLGLRYSLKRHFESFLRGPEIFGVETYLTGVAHAALIAVAVVCAVLAIRNRKSLDLPHDMRIHALAIASCGVTLHVVGLKVYPHYLIVFSPLLHILAVWLLSQRRALLWSACGLHLFVTATFLWFIHVHDGAPKGDYGVTYRAQTPDQRAFETQ